MPRIRVHSARPVQILLLLLSSSGLIPGRASSQLSGNLGPEVREAWAAASEELRDTLKASGMVGASWGLFSGGNLVSHEVFGQADLESGRRVDDATIYHWGSITKTLTGIAIMQLRDRGLLALDDPVVRYVPELLGVHNPYGGMDAVTLRQLLSHSAGFRSPTWPWGGSEPWHPHEPTEWSQIVAMLPYTRILFEPGTRYQYSNPGIVFLGQVIERLTGEEWEVYVEKNILRPLGMHRSYFDYTPYHLLSHRSNNYYVRDGVPEANGLDFDTGITVSNGGLNAPLGDMALYLAFLTDTGRGEAREHYTTVLPRASLMEMWDPVVPVGEVGGLGESMGLCFFIEEYGGIRFIGHTGSQKAFFSFLYIHPETGTGAIAVFNSQGIGDEPRRPETRGILNHFREDLFREVFPLIVRAGS